MYLSSPSLPAIVVVEINIPLEYSAGYITKHGPRKIMDRFFK